MSKTCLWCGQKFEPITPRKRFCNKKCYAKWVYRNDPVFRQKMREAWRRYRDKNREKLRTWAREHYRKVYSSREKELYPVLVNEFPDIVFLDKVTPDAYIPQQKVFCEVKVASTKSSRHFNRPSKYFDGLFFSSKKRIDPTAREIDDQIAEYPKPLLVIVFDVQTRKEIARRLFE